MMYYKSLSQVPFCFLSISPIGHKQSDQLYPLYADDSCNLYQHKEVDEIKKQLNKDFEGTCDWFVDNKLSVNFGEDKSKLVFLASKRRSKNIRKAAFTNYISWVRVRRDNVG